MNFKDWANTVLSTAIAGGIGALAQLDLDTNNFNFKRTGLAFLAGASVGLVQHFRPIPGTYSVPCNDNKLKGK